MFASAFRDFPFKAVWQAVHFRNRQAFPLALFQNAGGEETIRERSYPVAKATAITAGQVVQLSGGKVVPAAAAQTAAILGIAGEDHSGTADILNPRADGDEILVCDNPGLIFAGVR